VPLLSTTTRRAIARTAARLVGASLLSLGLLGCAAAWDDLRSNDIGWKHMFDRPPDPLTVLQKQDPDGNHRSRALAGLSEPLQHGGAQKEQDEVFQLLETAATKDQVPLCRLAALSTLGRFKDARAPAVIDAVYLQQLPFNREMNACIQQQCLNSLIEAGGPVALNRLVLVAKEPPSDGNAPQGQETLDRRLIAVRGLSKFQTPEATAALAYVLFAPKSDVALRDRAHESLVACTGKSLPADSADWKSYLGPQQPIEQTTAKTKGAATPAANETQPRPQSEIVPVSVSPAPQPLPTVPQPGGPPQ
jgi:hypothetical protein